jgi:hypothetical protein
MKIHSLENTGSISVDGIGILSLNTDGTIQLGTQTVYTVETYNNVVATGGTITNQSVGNQVINGDLIVTGSLTAQQFIVSSSVTYLTTSFASGSTKFGDTLDDVHGFTGSLSISGSLIINGVSYNTTTSGTSGTGGTSGTNGTAGSGGTSGSSGSSGSSGESGIYIGASTDTIDLSTLTIGVNKSLTTSVGLSYTIAQHVIVAYSLTEHFHGDVVSYNSGTGVLVLNVTDINTPTGTFSTWSTNLDGAAGGNGTSGTSGTNGTAGSGGTSGSSGVSGASGSSGATGSSGSAGTSGTSGTATTSTRVEENFIATAGQTTFTVTGGYTVGLVDVFVNGVRFLPTEYTATNGTTVVFGSGLLVNDEVTIINYTSVIVALPTSRNVQDFTATSGQTTFTVTNGYIVGLLDVFVNGSKLTSSEFTATNGTTFVLTIASTTGDQVQSINYTASVNGVSGAGTTNQLAYYTASSTLSSLTTSTYPSLTELSYVKGVTSSLQTQLNAKAATLSGTTNNIPKFTSSSAIGDSAITDNGTTVTLVGRALSGTTATFSSDVTISATQPNSIVNYTDATSYGRIYFNESGTFKSSIQFMGSSFVTTARRNALEIVNTTTGDLALGTGDARTFYIKNGGNVGIGTSSPAELLHVQAANNVTGTILVKGGKGDVTSVGEINSKLDFGSNDTSVFGDNSVGGRIASVTELNNGAYVGMAFYTYQQGRSPDLKEVMRITNAGQVTINHSTTNYDLAYFTNGSASPYGMNITFTGAAPNNTTNNFIYLADTSGLKCRIVSNGSIYNSTGTYGSISDIKLKENIVDTTPKLEDLLKVKVRNYNLIGDDLKQIGVVAQELETVFPSMVENIFDKETNETTKSVKYSIFVPMLVKAIQELSAKVTLLENN